MNHDATTPIHVETPEPITVLESALIAIHADSSKAIHLGPRQARDLCEYIDSLEMEKATLQSIIHDLGERDRLQMAVMDKLGGEGWHEEPADVLDE